LLPPPARSPLLPYTTLFRSLRLKTGQSAPAGANYRGRGAHPTEPTLVGFGILYLVVFVLAVQFSDFRDTRYNVPAYPFLFFFVAHSLARCQDAFPLVQRKIQNVFLASVVVFGLGTHTPLLSLDPPGLALSIKGYSYAMMPWTYVSVHAPASSDYREFIPELLERPFFYDI